MWLFSLSSFRWYQIKLNNNNNVHNNNLNNNLITNTNNLLLNNVNKINNDFKSRCSFSSIFDKDNNRILIFGGLNTLESLLNDLIQVKITFNINNNINNNRLNHHHNIIKQLKSDK